MSRNPGQFEALSLEACVEALHHIATTDRFTRVRIGEALKDEFGESAFDAWDSWYQGHDRYNASEAKSAWKSFGKGVGGKPCTIATLVYEAGRHGFKFNTSHQVKRSAEQKAAFEADRARRRKENEAAAEAAMQAASVKALEVWNAAVPAPADHPYLVRKGVQPHGARWIPQWVKEWTNPETGEIRTYKFSDALLVPLWSGPGKLASLQAIFPSKCIGPADKKRDKDYLADGRKLGCYFTFGRIKADTAIVLVCEGFATGGSLHEACGHPVVASFDAGNLEPVAIALRAKLPNAMIVICGDNDQFTLVKGKPSNPGLEAAQRAAKACAGLFVVPDFPADDPDQPTDFNDLAQRAGLDAVNAAIDQVVNPPPPPAPAPEPSETRPGVGAAPAPAAAAAPPSTPDDDTDGMPENNKHFTILGYNHERYYLFQHGKRQISDISKGDMGETGLIELAPLNWWEMHFPGDRSKIDTKAAANFIFRVAERRGIYDISRIRGRGAWVDAGRTVYHHGSYLSVDGEPTDITQIASRFVYELDRSLPDPAPEAMDADEGEMLLEVAQTFQWTKPGSAALLAGWVALAPLCGALRWRPHIWLTGGAGCGKSTVLNEYAHYLLGGLDLFAQGSSSEAGIRQTLRADARPVLFDESEQNNEREQSRIQGVLALIRQASTESEALTLKGSATGDAMAFHIRSMFCLASIQVGIKHQADVERLAVLSLRPKAQDLHANDTWKRISKALGTMKKDATLPSRLFRRVLDLLPVTLKNIGVFTEAASERFNSVRDGDQYGTLLAGAWSLISNGPATKEQALEMIDRYDWSEHRENNEMDEGQRALGALLEAHIRVNGGIEVTVYELICAAMGQPTEVVGIGEGKADAFLQRYGMRVKGDRLMVSNTSNELKRLMQGTQFEADLRGVLLRVEGADRNENKPAKFNGVQSKCITLPLAPIVDGGDRVAF